MSKMTPQTATKSIEIRPKKPKIDSFWPKKPQTVPKSPKTRSATGEQALPRETENEIMLAGCKH